MNFQNKLLVTIIPIAIIFVSTSAIVSYLIASDGIIFWQNKNMKTITHMAVDELEIWINEHERRAIFFSENGIFQAACKGQRMQEALTRLMKYHKISPFYENLFLADTNGKLFMDTIKGEQIGVDMLEISGIQLNVEKARQGEVWTSDVIISPVTDKSIFLTTAPVISEGGFVGIIGISVDLAVFSDIFLSKVTIGKTGYLYLTDSKGNIVAHPNKKFILKNSIYNYDFGEKMLAQKTGQFVYDFQGTHKIAYLATYDKKGWLLVAATPANEVLEAVKHMRNISFLLGLSGIMLLSLVPWLITNNVFKVINRAVTDLEEVSRQMVLYRKHFLQIVSLWLMNHRNRHPPLKRPPPHWRKYQPKPGQMLKTQTRQIILSAV